MSPRQVYVISDLHLGGVYPAADSANDRGFRICTHVESVAEFVDELAAKPAGNPAIELVINGDMVDFLAERDEDPPHWVPFNADPSRAVAKLEAIIGRDRVFFDSLAGFLNAGHRLVITLGNHDIELVLPPVRKALEDLMGLKGTHDYQFIYDGEAYIVGDALIEHGNRYDQFNVVDQDALRRVRSLISRRQPIPDEYAFDPPAGSKMVAEVINPIKEDYKFIDLLKPENEAVIPLLLAVEPGYRKLISKAVEHSMQAHKHRLAEDALPSYGGDIASETGSADDAFGEDISAMDPSTSSDNDPLAKVLETVMGDDSQDFLREVAPDDIGDDISTFEAIDRTLGLVKMLLSRSGSDYEKRLPLLLKSFRALQDDNTFDESVEAGTPYIKAAQALAENGIRHVIFGHTHMAKRVPLSSGGFYLNSGTWADVMQFPAEIITGSQEEALEKVKEFVELMVKGDFSPWSLFRPTYVRLDVDAAGKVTEAELCHYQGSG